MAARTPLIVGNWKMHKTVSATRTSLHDLVDRLDGVDGVEVGVAPPYTALAAAHEILAETEVRLGGQNMHAESEGAYTGEVSAVMLTDVGADFVILGHSERRQLFHETDEDVARKLRTALAHDLTPFLCVGETREEREADRTDRVVARQLRAAIEGLSPEDVGDLVIAYEPVWAIGTGLTATPAQAQEVHAAIRRRLADLLDGPTAARIRIQYGGSVKPDNAAELLAQPDIDGALVGGASLDAGSFAEIAKAADTA